MCVPGPATSMPAPGCCVGGSWLNSQSPRSTSAAADGPAKGKLERNVGGGRGEIQAPPRARTGFWALPTTFSNARAPAVTPPPRLSLQLTKKAHHTGGGFVLCLCKIHSRCKQLLTHAPAKLLLPGTSEHFTRAIKSTRECKAPADSNVPFPLSYPIHFSPFNSQAGFYQHSNLCWSAVLTYHILSDIIIRFLEGRTPNLTLSRVSQTQTTMH